MVAVFYNQKLLNNTLIIVLNNNKIIKQDINEKFVIGYYENNEISYINIFEFNKYMKLNEGYIKLDEKLCSTIKKIIGIDLSKYINANDFVVGHIDQCVEIKGSHLHKCIVNIGNQTLQIVCGAKNVKENINVVVALIGAILPNGKIIKEGQILGTKSYGMICSKNELNLNDDKFNNDGIIILPSQYKLGDKFNEIFN
ncbi:MAG: hypothetical protein J6Y96_01225 [Mycoplasma sp.]|nr:hypothetical protein [Mycoplasma sp.]